MMPMIPPFEPTEEMRKAFDAFLKSEFSDFTRPKFRDEQEKDTALRCWWSAEVGRLHAVRKIHDFRLSFNHLISL